MLIDITQLNVSDSKSILSFETKGGGSWEVWDRYLAIEGKQAFHIGNVCGTCSFFFERMEGANKSVSPKELSDELNKGVSKLDNEFIDSLKELIPNGEYQILLVEISPSLTNPGGSADYFTHEQVELWGIDGFWGVPHYPKTEYYRLNSKKLNGEVGFYEFLIPTFPHSWLENERVEFYRERIRNGDKPTAVSLGVFDIKEPADWEGEKSITSHHCLAHYLVDGHHKVYASVLEGKPITLVSFLAVEQGVSSKDDINELVSWLKMA